MRTRIVYAADESYAMPLAVSLRSLVDNASDPDVTILVRRLSDGALDKVLSSCPEITPDVVTVMEERFADLPVVRHITTATYLRLLIPALFPDDDPVLYVDADTVVLADPAELCRTPLEGRPLGAIPDPAVPRVDAPGGVQHWAQLGLPADTPYFNAGVLLVNPAVWREQHITEETLAYVSKYGSRIFLDQEALNAVVRGNWLPLDPAWNVYPELAGAAAVARRMGEPLPLSEEVEEALTNPKLVHFVGADKPWLPAVAHAPFSRTFYHYLDRTAWAGWRPDR
ncbi:glycosyltransferase family 8 protein [Actinophytocola algeriensis]|uniref:Lipopolysaccharide biosynthesis glycosyltransferase n=1 Tax=Actinophytocola algeriensis TaxID=1768010 RepID=A0A7W7Q3Q3_9PSEU|nr:glycosyltransferase family 8 protein [Actinophytocola algeriensis]MBB4906154.1 lipopolysaccharide biosynthesis glycosyltransferase [Actinophytocola algeriensis]MBE1472161.1 lipopolysaccharide biosynthesis glycosyltransferase [Actinophytocola algeriensis]